MLNVINKYEEPKDVSTVSGIPKNWNRSKFNQAKEALKTFEELCRNAKARYLLISFNSDGFIKKDAMIQMLSKIGEVTVMEKEYNTFRGSRNLNNRDIHIKEFLYLVEVYQYKEEK
jgi:adenine-specific DNA-methyltransferase